MNTVPLSKAGEYFVGRDKEKSDFLAMLRSAIQDPESPCRILYFHGQAGIGKTRFLREMEKIVKSEYSGKAAPIFIDLFSTENRTIDGIQETIIVQARQHSRQDLFAEFRKEGKHTPKVFRACLTNFWKKTHQVLVLIFDTFENVQEDKAGDWILSNDEGQGLLVPGLQAPGLVTLVASRRPTQPNGQVKVQELPGLSEQETVDLYRWRNPEDEIEDDFVDFCKELTRLTRGDPLLIELTFASLRAGLWDLEKIRALSENSFEEGVLEFSKETAPGSFTLGSRLSHASYESIICMAYMNRRFTGEILRQLIQKKYISNEDGDPLTQDEIDKTLGELRQLFFVKSRTEGNTEVFQLHDKMTELVMQHLWRTWEPLNGLGRSALQKFVIEFYESQYLQDGRNPVYQAERLYYTLQYNLEEGQGQFFDLVEQNDPELEKLLPGEMRRFVDEFDAEPRFEILVRMAEIEMRNGHTAQARMYWQDVYNLARELQDPERQVRALLGLYNVYWQENPLQAQTDYLDPALQLAERSAPNRKADIYYEFGWTSRVLQDFPKAIDWYVKARDESAPHPNASDPSKYSLYPTILNDLGYAYTFIGEYDKAEVNVTQALKERQKILAGISQLLPEARQKMEQAEGEGQKRKLHNELDRLEYRQMNAEIAVGLSFNTLGDIYRFQGHHEKAIYHHNQALDIFEKYNYWRWQVKARYSRSEANRRLASEKREIFDFEAEKKHLSEAWADLRVSLPVCEQHQVYDERDTVYRRMGRLEHDKALYTQDPVEKRRLLESAMAYFEDGLKIARFAKDSFEELNHLTEIAFLADDLMGLGNTQPLPVRFKEQYIDPLSEAIERYEKDSVPIYQLGVFRHLRDMELGAYYYRQHQMEQARDYYLSSFTGLAIEKGYGTSRFLGLKGHLFRQIEQIEDKAEAVRWCNAFIQAWETTRMQDPNLALDQVYPDISEWMRNYKKLCG